MNVKQRKILRKYISFVLAALLIFGLAPIDVVLGDYNDFVRSGSAVGDLFMSLPHLNPQTGDEMSLLPLIVAAAGVIISIVVAVVIILKKRRAK